MFAGNKHFSLLQTFVNYDRNKFYNIGPSWGINKDPTLWVDGARLSPKYVFKNNKILMN